MIDWGSLMCECFPNVPNGCGSLKLHNSPFSHNMHLVYPQKFCTTILFDLFCWDDCITLEKLEKKMVMQNLGGVGVNRLHCGLCENGEC